MQVVFTWEADMFKRKALARFEDWYRSSGHKALLVKGARQVGKTYLVNAFAHERFENVVAFDMVEDRAARESFAAATSADDLFLRMTVAASAPMVPGKTLVFIDEVQLCPNVVSYIKYLVQRDGFRYVLSGSLLGVEIENVDSLPVGGAGTRQIAVIHPVNQLRIPGMGAASGPVDADFVVGNQLIQLFPEGGVHGASRSL